MRIHKLSKENKETLKYIILAVSLITIAVMIGVFLFMLIVNTLFNIKNVNMVSEYAVFLSILSIIINIRRILRK